MEVKLIYIKYLHICVCMSILRNIVKPVKHKYFTIVSNYYEILISVTQYFSVI